MALPARGRPLADKRELLPPIAIQPQWSYSSATSPRTSLSSPSSGISPTNTTYALTPRPIASERSGQHALNSQPVLYPQSSATLASPTASSSPSAKGPTNSITSGRWSAVPPRPKPGRKPATDVPASKRKAQNREAQRNFRERRALRIEELEREKARAAAEGNAVIANLTEQVEAIKQQHEATRLQNERIQRENEELQKRMAFEREKFEKMTRQWSQGPQHNVPVSPEAARPPTRDDSFLQRDIEESHMRRASNESRRSSATRTLPPLSMATLASGNHQNVLPPYGRRDAPAGLASSVKAEAYDEMEIDMTQFGRNSQSNPIVVDQRTPGSVSTPMDDTCGFCTDSTNCVCRSEVSHMHMPEPSTTNQYMMTPPDSTGGDDGRRISLDPPATMEPPSSASGPGSCPSCQTDPQRKQFCVTLATSNPPKYPSFSARGSVSSNPQLTPTSIPDPRTHGRITCSDAYDILSANPNFERNKEREGFYESLAAQIHDPDHCADSTTGHCAQPLEVDVRNVVDILRGMKEQPDRESGEQSNF